MLQSIQDFKDVVQSIDKVARRITKQSAAIAKDLVASDGTIIDLVLGQLEDQRRRPVVIEAQKLLKELSADSVTIPSELGSLVEAVLGADEPTKGTAAEVWNGDAYSDGFGV